MELLTYNIYIRFYLQENCNKWSSGTKTTWVEGDEYKTIALNQTVIFFLIWYNLFNIDEQVLTKLLAKNHRSSMLMHLSKVLMLFRRNSKLTLF